MASNKSLTSAHADQHGGIWIIRVDVKLGDRAIESYWSGDGWIQVKEKAQQFVTEAAAASRAAELSPPELKPVVAAKTFAVEWDDSHSLSALLSRAEELISRGRLQDSAQGRSLMDAVRAGAPHRAELAQRLRDLCDLAETTSLAEGMFLQILRRAPTDRAVSVRSMVGSIPPTYEEEWLEFKSGHRGPAAKPAPLDPETVKDIWSKSLAGFANTGGGVLIWGIEARKMPSVGDPTQAVDAASDVRLVPHPESLKSDLLRLHHVATDPPVVGVRVEHVTEADGRGFVVCFVPESGHKPHRAELCKNKQYYLRVGDDFVVMQPSVLRSLFFPKAAPQYTVRIRCRGRNLQTTVGTIDVFVTIQNSGSATAREPFVVLSSDAFGSISPNVHPETSWEHVPVENGAGMAGRSSIHPGATAPPIRADYPKLTQAPGGQIIIQCAIHSLDTPPKRFSATFELSAVLAGNDVTKQATELIT